MGASSAKPSGALGKIAQYLAEFEAAHKARIGVSVVDLRTGKTLYAHRAGEPLAPASNQKLLTTAFALSKLGPKFAFTTSLWSLGDDLVITGRGDPLLGDPILARRRRASIYQQLDRWAQAVRQTVGPAVSGDLILAARTDSQRLYHGDCTAHHRTRWYGAPVADLNFHNNCYDVTFARQGQTVVPVITPASRFIEVVDKTHYNPKKHHRWRLRTTADESAVTITGNLRRPSNDPYSVPVANPPMVLGRVFADRLARAGVKLNGTIRCQPPDKLSGSPRRLIARTQTPLADVLTRANKQSLNMVAECLLLRAGDGAWAGSARQMHDTLVRQFALDGEELVVRDGSGLSGKNRISPRNLTKLLAALADGDTSGMVLASLSRNGLDGSLRHRMKAKAHRGRVAGKTGTIARVKTLSGYILDTRGRPVIAFSILANDLRGQAKSKARTLQDTICRLLVDWVDQFAAAEDPAPEHRKGTHSNTPPDKHL